MSDGQTPAASPRARLAWAPPLLALLAWRERESFGPRSRRDHLLGFLAGALFAANLTFWHHAIEAVGAGLSTVLGNTQVVFVALIAWAALGERPENRSLVAVPVVFGGVVLISGVIGSGAYGDDPQLGVVFGLLNAFMYALFLLILRNINADIRRPAGPLFDATLSAAVFGALGGLAVGDIDFLPGVESQLWLLLLAVSSQVLGWMLISTSLPRLPALLTSIVLMLQPVGTMLLGMLIFSESPSGLQLAGVVVVLAGVGFATMAPAQLTSRRRPVSTS